MLLNRWEHVVSDIAVGMGYELIDLEMCESGLVRIFIDIVDNTRDVSVKDCELLTRQLLYQLPVENLAFERLEVSSPGIDRKLTKASHFERFMGSRIKISLKESVDNIKNFEGILRKNEFGGDGDVLETGYALELLDTKHKFTLSFSIGELSSARLVGETFSKGRKHE
ncbi:ribosome maturation factor RimP [Betaproteobacteria bacterium]|nr:ribosome maturation factor RimP [Betaproteobacteria bacterium]